MNLINEDKLLLLYGGQHQNYITTIEGIFRKLSSAADLVFFSDGTKVDDKLETWKQRQDEKYQKTLAMLDLIYQKVPLSTIISSTKEIDFPRVGTAMAMIMTLAAKFGQLNFTITHECDAEIARYANNNENIIGVLADDSDFLIFPGLWRYFSLRHLDRVKITTLEYNKTTIRDFLGLSDKQLIILSTIAGNDIIKYDEVLKFMKVNCHQGQKIDVRFPWLARYVKSLPVQLNATIDVISKNVLKDCRPCTKDRIKTSLKQYDTVRISNRYFYSIIFKI